MNPKLLWGITIVCIGALIGGWLLFTEEYKTHVWTGESKKAKSNPYLAAERFLEGRGVRVTSDNEQLDFSAIPTSDLVFLAKVDSMLVSQTQVDDALDWVSRGGYLLVGVAEEIEGHASILKEFDIEPEYQDVDIVEAFLDSNGNPMSASERMEEVNRKIEENRLEEQERILRGEDPVEEEKPVELSEDDSFNAQIFDLLNVDFDHEFYRMPISDSGEELYLAVLDRMTLNHPKTYSELEPSANDAYEMVAWVDDEHGERLLQFNYGEGTFTALSSSQLWTNKYIGLGDHAYFLSYLLPDDSTVHLFYDVVSPSIGQLLVKYFYEAISAGLLLLMLWLWSRSLRVQRVIEVVQGQRRSFAQHLRSSATFLVAKKKFKVLVDPIREDIEQQMRPFYPKFAQLNEHAQVGMLAERTGLNDAVLQDWFRYCNKIENQNELIAALKIGNAIRKKL